MTYFAHLGVSSIDIVEEIKRQNFESRQFFKGEIVEIHFEINFFCEIEIQNFIKKQFSSDSKFEVVKDNLGLEGQSYFINVYFDVPGIDVQSEKEIFLAK